MIKKIIIVVQAVMLLCIPSVVFAGTEMPYDMVTYTAVRDGVEAPIGFEVDDYGRPIRARILLTHAMRNNEDREPDTPTPAHLKKWLVNKKIVFQDTTQYLWNRGHLVGYQFGSKASNSRENITPMTDYLNRHLMLHYEGSASKPNTLAGWLTDHPDALLEYEVEVYYATVEDVIPQNVTLAWRARFNDGSYQTISLPSSGLVGDSGVKTGADGWSYVTLDNIQPGYKFSYKTGVIGSVDASDGQKIAYVDPSIRYGSSTNASHGSNGSSSSIASSANNGSSDAVSKQPSSKKDSSSTKKKEPLATGSSSSKSNDSTGIIGSLGIFVLFLAWMLIMVFDEKS